MRHATALLYHVCAVASRNVRFASCGTSGNLTLWTRYVYIYIYMCVCVCVCVFVSLHVLFFTNKANIFPLKREKYFQRLCVYFSHRPSTRKRDEKVCSGYMSQNRMQRQNFTVSMPALYDFLEYLNNYGRRPL
jgi:hypothetical protein